jgi:hypothetical protein
MELQTKHEELFGQLHTPSAQSSHPVLDISTTLICNNIPVPVLRLYSDEDTRNNPAHEVFQKILQFIRFIN